MISIKELCDKYNISQADLSRRFDIPIRTIQDWHGSRRTPPDYVVKMMVSILENDKK